MYGDKATKLISHIQWDQGDLIPPYEYKLIEEIMNENDELYSENVRTSQSITSKDEPSSSSSEKNIPSNGGPSRLDPQSNDDNLDREEDAHDDIDISEKEIMMMQIRHTAKLWNKRCILAYHYERLDRLKRLRWEYGNNLPSEIIQNITKDELDWFTKYNDNLFRYMNALNDGKGLDLTIYMRPPKRLTQRFRCLRDFGQFEVDGESRVLKKNHFYHLALSDCEKLVQQGVLERDKEENFF